MNIVQVIEQAKQQEKIDLDIPLNEVIQKPLKRTRRRKKRYKKAPVDDFTIEPLRGQKTYTFSDTLPSHPARMLLVGASQLSGKTTVLFSLLSKRFPFFTFYGSDNIYVICETIFDDHRWRNFKLRMDNISSKWDPKFISMIEEKVSENKKPSLLICDDIIPIQGTQRDNEPFYSVFTRGRHYGENRRTGGGLSIWCTTQYYKALGPIVRANCSNLCVWLASDAEVNKIYEEHSNGLRKDEWYYIYKYATVKPHSFLHINYANPSRVDGRFCLRLEKVLQIEGHEDEDLENAEIEKAEEKSDIRVKPEPSKENPSSYNKGKPTN